MRDTTSDKIILEAFPEIGLVAINFTLMELSGSGFLEMEIPESSVHFRSG